MSLIVGELMALLKLDDGQFHSKMDKAGGAFGGLGKIAGAAALAAGAALISVGVAATTMAMGFQKDMKNVETLLGKDATEKVKAYGQEVKNLAQDTGKDLSDMSDGLYQVISAWGDSGDAVKQLEISAKASAAGLATTTDAVNLLSAHTKGYGDTSAAATQKAADLAFMTANLGQTTFPELAATMGRVIPLAATLKVKEEDLYGAMATLTGVTGNTAEVTTQLRATMQALLNPSKDMSTAIAAAGYASGEAMIKSLGLQGTLDLLAKSTGGNTQELAQMFGSTEALGAVLSLTGNQAKDFTEKTKAMYDATGAANAAFDKQQESVDAMLKRLKQMGTVMMVELGEKFLPLLESLAKWVMQYMPQIKAFFEGAFNAIGAAVKGLGVIITELLNNVWIPLIEGFKTGSTDMQGPIAEWYAKVGEAVKGVAEYLTNFKENIWKPLVEGWTTGNTDMGTSTGTTFALIGDILRQAADVIGKVITAVMLIWNEWGDDIMGIVGVAFNTVLTVIQSVLKILGGALDVFIGLFTGDWGRMSDGLVAIWQGLWDGVAAILDGIWAILGTILAGLWESIKGWFVGIATDAYTWGVDMMKGFLNGIMSMFAKIWSKVTDFIEGVVDAVKGVLDINSPSKVFRDIGANVGKGLALGIEGTESLVARAMQGITPSVAFDGPGGGMDAGAGGASGWQTQQQPVNITVTVPLDGQVLAQTTIRHMVPILRPVVRSMA